MSWLQIRFGDLYEIPSRNGLNRPRSARGSGYKMINMGEIFGHDRIGDIPMERVQMTDAEIEKFSVGTLDLMFARQSMVEAGAGKCSIVTSVSEITCFESHLIRVRLNRLLGDPLFYYYYFRSYFGRSKIEAIVTGAAQKGIRGTDLEDVSVDHPPLLIQRGIASILSTYDRLIENNARRIAVLEEMARRLYEEWFVHFRFPGHEDATFTDTEHGRVPDGWEPKVLGDLVADVRQTVHPSQVDPETPYVGLEHIPRRSITLREWSTADKVGSNKLVFRENDILFGKIRPYFHKVCIAPIEGICSSDTILLRPVSPQVLGVALSCASSDAFVEHATQTSNGTKMPRANWGVLQHYPVVLPPEPLLSSFNDFVGGVVAQTKNLMRKNANLCAQRDLLLPKLISGEIDVSGAEKPLEVAVA